MVCGASDETTAVQIPAKGHSLDRTAATEATCTEAGNIEYWTCKNCGEIFSNAAGKTAISAEETVIPAKGHTITHVAAKEANCTEEGNTEYWTCSVCNEYFSDADGKTAITLEETVTPAKGHTITHVDAKEATCTEDGNNEYWTCSTCGELFSDAAGTTVTTQEAVMIAKKGHILSKIDAKEAACTDAGNNEYWTCITCGKLYSDSDANNEINETDIVIAATGHTVTHVDAKEATCTEAGNNEYWACGKCGKLFGDEACKTEISQEDTVKSATGHDWNEWTVQKEATEDEEGLEVRTCKNDPSHKEERSIAKLPHTHNLTKTEAKAATCTESGNIEYWTCSKCGKYYSDANAAKEITKSGTVISAKGHSWSDWTVTKKATCTENGSRAGTCAVCGVKTTEVIKATGHKWNTAYTIDRSPTASSTGSKSIHCSVCGSIKPGSVQTIPSLNPTWKKDSTGWWYDYGDGSYPVSKFENIGGKTYYFNGTGYMVTGWQFIGGRWYYFNSDGAMQTGWQHLDGTWYYLNGSGVMVTGLQSIGGVKYYFNASGAMQTGWQYIGGKWYYFNGDGAMQTGWQHLDGTWYYLNGSGVMVTGWQNIGGVRYYFNGSGAMQTGWQYIGGKWYYFNGDGAMQTGWRYLGGTWYYLSGTGAMATGWQYIGGKWYYLNGSGAMQTGWQKLGGSWYYLNGDGSMRTGWLYDGGEWYYMNRSGAMVTGRQLIDGTWYSFNASGAML